MRVERHTGVEAIASMWDDLADDLAAPPWLRPAWVSAWVDAFGAGGSVEVLAVHRDDSLAGVLPMLRRRRTLRSPTNWHTPEFGMLADGEAKRMLADALLEHCPRSVVLGWVSDECVQAMRAAAARAGYRTLERPLMQSPYVTLDGAFVPPRRATVRRHRRQLEKSGEVRVDIEHDAESFEHGLLVEASGWKREEGTAIVSQAQTRRFYERVARWAADRRVLRLFFLRLDDRPIAFVLGIEDCGRLFYVKGGYDEEFRRFGPGVILAHAMVEHAQARGLRSFEFLGDDDPWKLEWTDVVRERYLFRAFAPGPTGDVERAVHAYVHPLARRIRAALPGLAPGFTVVPVE